MAGNEEVWKPGNFPPGRGRIFIFNPGEGSPAGLIKFANRPEFHPRYFIIKNIQLQKDPGAIPFAGLKSFLQMFCKDLLRETRP